MSEVTFTKYCSACGNGVVDSAAFCHRCGTATAQLGHLVVNVVRHKYKKTAILLSVYLGFWSWLYTFRRNYVKFTISLVVTGIGLLITLLEQFSRQEQEDACSQAIHDSLFFGVWNGDACQRYNPTNLGIVLVFAVWIWAVVDNARKPLSFFESYTSTN